MPDIPLGEVESVLLYVAPGLQTYKTQADKYLERCSCFHPVYPKQEPL